MKLKVLVDNHTLIDRYFIGEPGVSYYIEEGDVKLLFDTGYSDVFIKNASKMNVNLLDLTHVVISHGHLDHTWGLVSLIRLYTEAMMEGITYDQARLIAHPQAFLSKTLDADEVIGSILDSKVLSQTFDMKLSQEPMWLSRKLVFLGEIPRTKNYENTQAIGQYEKNGIKVDDYLIDDSAMAYTSENGLVIITGCSHAGICNIIEYAKKVCKEDRIVDVIGGFHLLNPSQEQLKGTMDYFAQTNIEEVHACHCTDLKSKIALSKIVELKEVGVGLAVEYL